MEARRDGDSDLEDLTANHGRVACQPDPPGTYPAKDVPNKGLSAKRLLPLPWAHADWDRQQRYLEDMAERIALFHPRPVVKAL